MVKRPNKSAISLPVLKGLKFRFSPTIFGILLLLFDCFFFFVTFPAIIVQILSFEQKLLLGIEYPFEETVQNSQVDHTTTPLTIQSRHFRQDLVMKRSKPRLT